MTLSATVTVEINFPANATWSNVFVLDSPTKGLLNTGQLVDSNWFDVSAHVRAINIRRPPASHLGTHPAATASVVLDNRSRVYDPTYSAGPYFGKIKPNRRIRVRATYAGTVYDLFYGYADGWDQQYPSQGADAITTVTATDITKQLAARNLTPLNVPDFGGDTTGTRIGRVLDSLGFDASARDLDTGTVHLQATNYGTAVSFSTTDNEAVFGLNAWEYLRSVNEAEGGALYIDGAGRVTFDSRHSVVRDTRSTTSNATFGQGSGELPYTDMSLDYSDDTLVTRSKVTREGGTMQTAESTAAQNEYGVREHEVRGSLHLSDPMALNLADWTLQQYLDAEQRIESLTFKPEASPALLYPQALGRKIRDRVTAKFAPSVGSVISQPVLIEGWEHQITPGDWTVRWSFSSADRFDFLNASLWMVLGTGQLGTNTVAA